MRGCETRVVNGSEGLLLGAELRSPAFHPSALTGITGLTGLNGSARAFAFWDYARLGDPDTQPGNPDLCRARTRKTAGPGSR